MTSLIKRNKNLVSKLIKDMSRFIDNDYPYGHRLYIPGFYGVTPQILTTIKFKLRAAEDDTCIYIGYDLNAPYTVTYNPDSFGNSLHDLIKYKAFPRWGSGDKDLIQLIGHSKEEVEQNPMLLDKIALDLDNKIKDFLSSATVEYELRDKQYPRLKDRKVLPLAVIDTTNGTVNFCHDSFANTYRQGRSLLEIDDFKNNNMRTAVENTSFGLFVNIIVKGPLEFRVV